MAAPTVTFRCSACGAGAARWAGRCGACDGWNTLGAVAAPGRLAAVGTAAAPGPGAGGAAPPVPLAGVDLDGSRPRATGLSEIDRVLGGGLVPGSMTLLYGEPGVGKSTLLLQVLAAVAAAGPPVLLVSAEESAAQVRGRAERLGPLPAGVLITATGDLGAAEEAVALAGPALVVVDSIQTVRDPDVPGPPGSLAQVRAGVDRLSRLSRRSGAAVVVVGHVTKDGDLAGPRSLEHLVDTVLAFEGDRHHSLRMLRALKHRFGPTGEVGLFEMGEGGLADVADPGALLLGDRRPEIPGSAVTALLEGRRPLLAEVQALVVASAPATPCRRSAQGLDGRRLGALLAVLEVRAAVPVAGLEVFVSLTGGIRSAEPATDLAVALAVAAAAGGRSVDPDTVAFGEVGLAGEVRQVPGPQRRLAEAGRLGFHRALVPAATTDGPPGMELVRVATVAEALAAAAPAAGRSGGGHRPDDVVDVQAESR